MERCQYSFLLVIFNIIESYRVSSVCPPLSIITFSNLLLINSGQQWTAVQKAKAISQHACFQTLMRTATIAGLTSVSTCLSHLCSSTDLIRYPVAHPIRINTTSSMWCSAACPTGNKALFAIGTSDGLHTLEGFGSHWTLSQKPFPGELCADSPNFRRHGNSSHASVNAVEWLSSDVIASGLRNSTIFLHDLRSGGSAARLKHPHSVSKIRKVDEYRMVVGGYNSVWKGFTLLYSLEATLTLGSAPNV